MNSITEVLGTMGQLKESEKPFVEAVKKVLAKNQITDEITRANCIVKRNSLAKKVFIYASENDVL